MNALDSRWISEIFTRAFEPNRYVRPSDFCATSIRFDEPDCRGAFSFIGREYLREPLDNWADDSVTDQVQVWGTRLGKTRGLYGGLAYTVAHRSVRCLYVKPKANGTAGASDDARTRFIPMIRASEVLAKMIPGGARRHDFKTAQQIIRGCIIDWTGSNSVSALASNPCGVVIQDEVDKFNVTRKRDSDGTVVEADASSLADERTKDVSLGVTPKRFKVSTPTLVTGLIWTELMKSDVRRRFVPCPHCTKKIVLAWSPEFTVLPKIGLDGQPLPLSYVKWDQSAKSEGGKWDLDAVEASARVECCHCNKSIHDRHKTAMDAGGEWKPTQIGAPGYRGYHLPSLYSTLAECAFGRMAVRFLKGHQSLEGARGFINSDLAEPYASQDIQTRRIDKVEESVTITNEWRKLAAFDCQQKRPYFWHTVRAYSQKQCVGLSGGSCDSWDEVESIQRANNILFEGMIFDSGFGAKDDAEIYRNCAARGELITDPVSKRLYHLGWVPAKGMPGRTRWKDKNGIWLPYRFQPLDPYLGTAEAGKVSTDLFEFAADFFKDILSSLRANRAEVDYRWSIAAELDTEVYHEHMRGQHKVERIKRGVIAYDWERRHKKAHDHLFSCEVMQVAFATSLGFLDIEKSKKP